MSNIDESLFDFRRTKPKQTHPICDKHGCQKDGLYPAPKSPNNLKERYLFCLEHVRAYNSSWNFFSEFSDDAFSNYLDGDRFGHRPTWPLGNLPNSNKKKAPKNLGDYFKTAFDDPFDLGKTLFDEQPAPMAKPLPTASEEVRWSLKIFDLTLQDDFNTVKNTYKKLVKKYHPDVNRDNPKAEKMLKDVLKAFQILEKYFI